MFRAFNFCKTFLTRGANEKQQLKSFSSNGKFSGKVAVVTGSTNGIGFAIAQRLARDGASVLISSRKQENVDNAVAKLTSEGLKASGVVCHVGKAEDRKKLVDTASEIKNGVIDIFVSNAAVNPFIGGILDIPLETWEKIMATNVTVPFLFTRDVVPIMERVGGGSIVYVSSVGGYQSYPADGVPLIGAYLISKTAILGLARVMAAECASKNVRVNCICPGLINTKFGEVIRDYPGAAELFMKVVPLKRLGEPHECASVVSFLCSDDASYITGENIVVTGGYGSL